jgi:hypothetical protein
LGAIVSLGFCSASFVSPDGLIATNHHCVEGYLQYLSEGDDNHHRDGFLAATREDEENVGPTSRIRVVEKISDVTRSVMRGISSRTKDADRQAKIDRARKKLVAKCEQQPDRRCYVASYFGGSTYRLVQTLELQDIRMVYAPPMGLGQFGGDIDNWMWPRQSADFSFIRAYVAPDGSSAPYSEDNVPYQPAHHLKVSAESVEPGDFVMVAGYPGRTERHRLATELAHHTSSYLPDSRAMYQSMFDILASHAEQDPEAEARLGATMSSIANRTKNTDGMLEAFGRRDLAADKRAEEAAFLAWIRQDEARAAKLEPVYEELQAALEAEAAEDERDLLLRYLYRAADILGVTSYALRWAEERTKPDLSRDSGYQDRDRARAEGRFRRLDKSMWLPADRDLMAHLLAKYEARPAELRLPSLDAWLTAQGGSEAALDTLFTDPVWVDVDQRLALLDWRRSAFEASEDPWISLAVALETYFGPKRDAEDAVRGQMQRLRSQWMSAKRTWFTETDRAMYDDANGTLRLTLGTVQGYAPQDGLIATPQTTVAGLVAKVGEAPFDAPASIVERGATSPKSRWASEALGDVPVNHLSTLDITGGNSGSAVLDGKGQFVGLAFDGNWESIAADWIWLDDVTRCISVDVRFMLWVLDGEPDAARLLTEMGVVAPEAASAP